MRHTLTMTFSRVSGVTMLLAKWRRRVLYHGPLNGVHLLPGALRDPIQHNLTSDAALWAIAEMEKRS